MEQMSKMTISESITMIDRNLKTCYPGYKIVVELDYGQDIVSVWINNVKVYSFYRIALQVAKNPLLILDECIRRLNTFIAEPKLIIGS